MVNQSSTKLPQGLNRYLRQSPGGRGIFIQSRQSGMERVAQQPRTEAEGLRELVHELRRFDLSSDALWRRVVETIPVDLDELAALMSEPLQKAEADPIAVCEAELEDAWREAA